MSERYYKLSVFPLFEEDLSEIVEYISIRLKDPDAATRFVDEVTEAVYERLSNAESFPAYPSAKERARPYYAIPVRDYAAFYVVAGDTVELRRILHDKKAAGKIPLSGPKGC